MKQEPLKWVPKLCYGVGHFMNDLCASMWFSYILLFYSSVLQYDDMAAGYIMLVGQIADGISTPIVGILADKENKIPVCARYGRRKVIHLIGTVLVMVSFPFIFNSCLVCTSPEPPMGATFAFHAVFVIIFQFAWACVQVSHLALIPALACKKSQRTELNSIRYAFMVLANMLVFVITFIFLGLDAFEEPDVTNTTTVEPPTTTPMTLHSIESSDPTPHFLRSSGGSIGPEHLDNFRNVAITCIGIGAVFSTIFHLGTREPQFITCDTTEDGEDCRIQTKKVVTKIKKSDWFKMPTFYQVAAMYVCTRLYVNLYMTYIPLLVDKTLGLLVIFVAVVPMLMHFSSFLGSFAMKPVNRIIGRKRTFSIGCCVGLAACLWIGVGGEKDYFGVWGIFPVAVFLGVGGSILLITSLSITADLIGEHSEGGAFVYGCMSLLDKVSNGLVIMLIQKMDDGDPVYYKKVLAFACGAPCIGGLLVTLTLYKSRVGSRPREPSIDELMSEEDPSEKQEDNYCDEKLKSNFVGDKLDKDLPNGFHQGTVNSAFESDGHI